MKYQRLLLAFIFLIKADLLVLGRFLCINNGNYTSNSTYSDNLATVFSRLRVDGDGFDITYVGQGTDRVHTMVLCRGDVKLDACRECVQNATTELLNSCPNQKQAINWANDCILRFSDETIYGAVANRPAYYWWNRGNATSPMQFVEDLRKLLDSLRNQAAGSPRMVAAGNITGPDFQTIYAMVQCTPDLSPEDCTSCLVSATTDIQSFCDGKRGCRVLMPSCNLRFEIHRFFNDTRLKELEGVPVPVPVVDPPLHSSPDNQKDDKAVIAANQRDNKAIIATTVILGFIIIACAYFLLRWYRARKQKSQLLLTTTRDRDTGYSGESVLKHNMNGVKLEELPLFEFEVLSNATSIFDSSHKLGQGGFGPVYKGKLPNGQEVAVKRLARSSNQGLGEFMNEVELISKLQHRNLVRLLGCCVESEEKMLVYEYMPNGSLDAYLFDSSKKEFLDWKKRVFIIEGICRGLLYLHRDSRLRIIHRDLKASNILLDEELNPKICDFGMARIFAAKEDQANTTRVVGTLGYISPEYALEGRFSEKSDVYSFGVLLLEILSGRRNTSFFNDEQARSLIAYAWGLWNEENITKLVDPLIYDPQLTPEIMRYAHVGLLCVQEIAQDRPSISTVLSMLSSEIVDLPHPKPPAFIMHQSSSVRSSVNNVTVTILDGR